MARIEEEEGRDKLRREIRDEIRGSVRRSMQRARWAPFCGCFFGFILFLLLIAGTIALLGAKSGLVRIPSLSERIFKPPEPVRMVDESVPLEFDDRLQDQILESLRRGERSEELRIALTEEEVTAVLRESIAALTENPESKVRMSLVQIAVEEDFAELAARGSWQDKPLAALIKFVPKAVDGGLKFDILGARLGKLPIHPKLLSPVKTRLEEELARAMKSESALELQSIELSHRILYVNLRLPKAK